MRRIFLALVLLVAEVASAQVALPTAAATPVPSCPPAGKWSIGTAEMPLPPEYQYINSNQPSSFDTVPSFRHVLSKRWMLDMLGSYFRKGGKEVSQSEWFGAGLAARYNIPGPTNGLLIQLGGQWGFARLDETRVTSWTYGAIYSWEHSVSTNISAGLLFGTEYFLPFAKWLSVETGIGFHCIWRHDNQQEYRYSYPLWPDTTVRKDETYSTDVQYAETIFRSPELTINALRFHAYF